MYGLYSLGISTLTCNLMRHGDDGVIHELCAFLVRVQYSNTVLSLEKYIQYSNTVLSLVKYHDTVKVIYYIMIFDKFSKIL